MKPSLFLLTCLLLFETLSIKAQNIPLADFFERPIPILGSDELYKLNNRTGQEFKVSLANGKLQIEKFVYTSNLEYSLPEGKLLGINQGEFGGGLYYRPNDTTLNELYVNGQKRTLNIKGDPFSGGLMVLPNNPVNKLIKGAFLIKNGNIEKIFSLNDSLYVMEGLAHMSLHFGAFDKITIKGDTVAGSTILKLDDAPAAFDIYNNVIYVATLSGFYTVHNWKMEMIIDKLFWSFLGPTSVVVKDPQHIYVGMRAGYAIVNVETRKLRFFQYKD